MFISPALEADLDAVVALVNSAYRGKSEGWTTEDDYIDGQRTDGVILRNDLAANPEAVLLLLRDEEGGPILGTVWLEPAGEEVWYLGMFTVRPDLQGGQRGRGFLERAEAYVRERGATRMRMTVVHVRDTLIAWYQRRGYALTGETQAFPHGDERFGKPKRDDLYFVVMEKAL
ncbi:MAG: GNAT family N-acetyltransferase [Caulobacter sp.]